LDVGCLLAVATSAGAGKVGLFVAEASLEIALVLTRGGGCDLARGVLVAGGLTLLRGFGGALLAKRGVGVVSAGGGKLGAAGLFEDLDSAGI
jgi:hypothetical protein